VPKDSGDFDHDWPSSRASGYGEAVDLPYSYSRSPVALDADSRLSLAITRFTSPNRSLADRADLFSDDGPDYMKGAG
jgi:hypothetical protein